MWSDGLLECCEQVGVWVVWKCQNTLSGGNVKLMHVLCASVAQCTKFCCLNLDFVALSSVFSILSSSPFLFLLLFSSPCAEQEAFIAALLPETTYSVTVAAYTTKGDGARSKAKVATTTGAGVCAAYK